MFLCPSLFSRVCSSPPACNLSQHQGLFQCCILDPQMCFFFKDFFFFDGEHFLSVFTEFVTMLLLFHVLVLWPQGMWDLSFPTGSQTHTSCIGRQNLHHWATRDTPQTYSSYNWKSIPFDQHLHNSLTAQPLAVLLYSLFLWVQRFWIPHVSDITQYLSFCLAYLI